MGGDSVKEQDHNRRALLRRGAQCLGALALGGAVGALTPRLRARETVWQLDPNKCIQCGNCATACVLTPSAVKCVHAYAMCGFCELCTGFFEPQAGSLDEGAENQQCPTGAIKRSFVEDPYYEYVIDKALCIGCGKCVKGCESFGNGSLFLQVMHDSDHCVNCNQCTIAAQCPAQAYSRVPAAQPYILKKREGEG